MPRVQASDKPTVLSMKSSRRLDKVLQDAHDDLAILVTRTRQLRRLTRLLREQLDETLAPHCYIGTLEPSALTILVDSAAWASRLRFESSQIADKLRAVHPAFARLEQIRVKIITDLGSDTATAPVRSKVRPHISQLNANIINSLADSIDDAALHDALQRLARRVTS